MRRWHSPDVHDDRRLWGFVVAANLAGAIPVVLVAVLPSVVFPWRHGVELWILSVLVPGAALALSVGVSLFHLRRGPRSSRSGVAVAVALAAAEAQLRSGQLRGEFEEIRRHLARGEANLAIEKIDGLRAAFAELQRSNKISDTRYRATAIALSWLAVAAGLTRQGP